MLKISEDKKVFTETQKIFNTTSPTKPPFVILFIILELVILNVGIVTMIIQYYVENKNSKC